MFHTLRRGETLEMLSIRFGLPVCMLIRANPSVPLAAGSRLTIPPHDFCNRTQIHTVRRGETLCAIAARHRTTMYAILQKNGFSHPREITAGMQLKLPPPARIYTCTAADTVDLICKKFSVEEQALRRINHLTGNVYHGMQLILPD